MGVPTALDATQNAKCESLAWVFDVYSCMPPEPISNPRPLRRDRAYPCPQEPSCSLRIRTHKLDGKGAFFVVDFTLRNGTLVLALTRDLDGIYIYQNLSHSMPIFSRQFSYGQLRNEASKRSTTLNRIVCDNFGENRACLDKPLDPFLICCNAHRRGQIPFNI